ncbi:MAG: hypothetical protein EXR62_16615 [Chloroflexi bacterium]|nr:hypothetical protein [Chloroflexota bacterium]
MITALRTMSYALAIFSRAADTSRLNERKLWVKASSNLNSSTASRISPANSVSDSGSTFTGENQRAGDIAAVQETAG